MQVSAIRNEVPPTAGIAHNAHHGLPASKAQTTGAKKLAAHARIPITKQAILTDPTIRSMISYLLTIITPIHLGTAIGTEIGFPFAVTTAHRTNTVPISEVTMGFMDPHTVFRFHSGFVCNHTDSYPTKNGLFKQCLSADQIIHSNHLSHVESTS